MESILFIDGRTVKSLLDFEVGKSIIRQAYILHSEGKTVLPNSIFLRPDEVNRIIGLPATVKGDINTSGIKWVASYPGNYRYGIPRASSIVILNDAQTGYPYACINGSFINLFRTCCSAYLVTEKYQLVAQTRSLGIIGAGSIARCFMDCIHHFKNIPVDKVKVYDKLPGQAMSFIGEKHHESVSLANSMEELVEESDIILLATTASAPYISDTKWFSHNPLVLNISLRDLHSDIILASNNLVDDIAHVNREKTGIHMASMRVENSDFVSGTIVDLLDGKVEMSGNKPTVLSPFGLGILDIAIAKFIYDKAIELNKGTIINDFFN